MNRSGSDRTSVLVSPRPMDPPVSWKRATSSRSSGRPLKETARIVSIAPTFPEPIQSAACRNFTPVGPPPSCLNLLYVGDFPLYFDLYFGDFARLDYRPSGGTDGRAREAPQVADVPGPHRAASQDRSRLEVP